MFCSRGRLFVRTSFIIIITACLKLCNFNIDTMSFNNLQINQCIGLRSRRAISVYICSICICFMKTWRHFGLTCLILMLFGNFASKALTNVYLSDSNFDICDTQICRISREEVHKLKYMINQLILNRKCYINMCPFRNRYRVMDVGVSRGGNVLFHNCHKCL
jgi:hypothetical protein